jgi:LuxR family maltose regulon positive regulatory protein
MASVIEILVLQALALQLEGNAARAVSTLARALSLAEPEGYMRTFVDEGAPMAALLSKVLEAKRRDTSLRYRAFHRSMWAGCWTYSE